MANTYTQLRIQLVFAVKNRQALIQESFRERLQMYMTKTLQNEGHKMLAIYCMPDHCHILIGLDPQYAIADSVKKLKTASTNWINREKLSRHKFQWQRGYGAFSYSKSQTSGVIQYILNQPNHHKKQSFRDEYLDILNKLEIDFKAEYLFDFFE
ncbi:MAG: IS200/IS605 family transposase [Bacteroidia bacterium]